MKFTFVVGEFQPFSCFWARIRGFFLHFEDAWMLKKFETKNLCEHTTVRKKKRGNSTLNSIYIELLSQHFHIFCSHHFSTLCSLFNPTVNTFFFHSSFRLNLLLLFFSSLLVFFFLRFSLMIFRSGVFFWFFTQCHRREFLWVSTLCSFFRLSCSLEVEFFVQHKKKCNMYDEFQFHATFRRELLSI